MKSALIGVVAAVAATLATTALAPAVTEASGLRSQFYSNASSQTLKSGNPHTDDRRDWQCGNAMIPPHANESDRYRYHGGPKSND
jgi:hypothetical protein